MWESTAGITSQHALSLAPLSLKALHEMMSDLCLPVTHPDQTKLHAHNLSPVNTNEEYTNEKKNRYYWRIIQMGENVRGGDSF